MHKKHLNLNTAFSLLLHQEGKKKKKKSDVEKLSKTANVIQFFDYS